jgi:hypothetical protein
MQGRRRRTFRTVRVRNSMKALVVMITLVIMRWRPPI